MALSTSAKITFLPKSHDEFKKSVLTNIAKDLSRLAREARPQITEELHKVIADSILKSDDYHRITVQYYGQLGSLDIVDVLDKVIQEIINSSKFQILSFKRNNDRIEGGVRVFVLPRNYEDFLSSIDGASFESENGFQIYWLEWLLTAGTTPVVFDYRYIFDGSTIKFSRTEKGIMIPGDENFEIPALIAGTRDNNFITRAFLGIEKNIAKIVENKLREVDQRTRRFF